MCMSRLHADISKSLGFKDKFLGYVDTIDHTCSDKQIIGSTAIYYTLNILHVVYSIVNPTGKRSGLSKDSNEECMHDVSLQQTNHQI